MPSRIWLPPGSYDRRSRSGSWPEAYARGEAGRNRRRTRYGDSPPDSDRFVVSAPDGTKQTQRVRANVTADPRLDVLTLLGHRLPRTRSPEEAASEGTTALAGLD